MTGKNPGILVEFEPEIEARAMRTHGQTLQEKRKKQQEQANSEETSSTTNKESTNSSQNPVETNNTPIAEPTHAAAPVVQQPLCITFPQGETPFQLKTGLIHLIPTFHGDTCMRRNEKNRRPEGCEWRGAAQGVGWHPLLLVRQVSYMWSLLG
ncbi:hypothetical protein GQ457_16G014810 [Hibiscus cannabinus]